ncbi:YhcH/YjgK/YiaL family protein [Helicobacter turcicus]|uniref:YhcH/YjgK/YiaL family protein n=1 Tax=Helicobacter turcicus TaxID=2867412 RepID=A0ABS7JPA9_9HELI|nr:YhcH/YjgK/YiaL family protein [Helicobacter turcicus]MBX7491194.1 YhcH/YjgK/YiaL family protein [Helicobacter turcicus]MBX7546061.1 YhcH/YjgK/YiaL family protein [Helicobacter turcicus]
MFLGYLPDTASKFKKNEVLSKVFGYLFDVLDENSEAHQRICALEIGKKFEVFFDGGAKAIEQAYNTKSPKDAFYESHIEMVDFQMVVQGREIFFVSPNTLCEIKKPLDSATDLIEYHPSAFISSVQLFPGNLAVFEAIDVHAGGIATDSNFTPVKKVVVKVPKEYVKLNF